MSRLIYKDYDFAYGDKIVDHMGRTGSVIDQNLHCVTAKFDTEPYIRECIQKEEVIPVNSNQPYTENNDGVLIMLMLGIIILAFIIGSFVFKGEM